MGEVITIGLDLAKSVFQAHGADASGEVDRNSHRIEAHAAFILEAVRLQPDLTL